MKKKFCFVLAQLNFLVGDIEGNTEKIIQQANLAKEQFNADLVIFPELAITGYPPEDLLLRDYLYERVLFAVEQIKKASETVDILLGYPCKEREGRFNTASLFCDGKIVATHRKNALPNYAVFDEVRYFNASDSSTVVNYKGLPLGILICEDLWQDEPLVNTAKSGAKLVISLNASPFDLQKHEARMTMLSKRTKAVQIPILYVNCVGGQDELVFDGGSLVFSHNGDIYQQGPFYRESLIPVHFEYEESKQSVLLSKQEIPQPMSYEERAYTALVLGVRDYIDKNHFQGAVIGLSGGIDSALTLAIAVDAIGPENVEGILMPSRYTAQTSIDDAKAQANLLAIKTTTISIEPIFTQFLNSLAPEFKGLKEDTTEENLQARCRGTLLMAISNKKGFIVLATGNKSEFSVGYCTLYGDMVGGFCVLKDIPKTLVYKLAHFRNKKQYAIPNNIFTKEPTAELAYNQRDQDTLPPYPILDQILELYIENDKDPEYIVEQGFDQELVRKVVKMVDRNEYKRRQAAPGVRITTRAFGRDRRYPITSGYNKYLFK